MIAATAEQVGAEVLNEPAEDLLARISARIAASFNKFPRKSGTGPGHSRYEHWAPSADESTQAVMIARTLTRLVGRKEDMPEKARKAMLAAILNGIPKKDGGVRVLGCGGTIRRLVARAVAKELNSEIAQGAGPQQYGLQKDGAGSMFRYVSAKLATEPDKAAAMMDISNAFPTMSRQAVKNGCIKHSPQLWSLMKEWFKGSSKHIVRGDGDEVVYSTIEQAEGLDQGCPLSPGLYTIAVRDALEDVLATMKGLDPTADIVAYLDDTILIATGEALEAGVRRFMECMEEYGLKVHPGKTKVWSSDANNVSEDLRQYMVPNLEVLGAEVIYVRSRTDDTDEVGGAAPRVDAATAEHGGTGRRADATMAGLGDQSRGVPGVATMADQGLGAGGSVVASTAEQIPGPGSGTHLAVNVAQTATDPKAFLDLQDQYLTALRALFRQGLSAVHVMQLLRTWSQGACVHILRNVPVTQAWATEVDKGVTDFLSTLLGALKTDQVAQAFLPSKDGGLGLGSARLRAAPAFVGAWEGGLQQVCSKLQVRTLADWEQKWPQWAEGMNRAEATLTLLTGKRPNIPWAHRLAGGKDKRQHTLTVLTQQKAKQQLVNSLDTNNRRLLQSAEGTESLQFLQPPPDEAVMSTKHALVAMRYRLRMDKLVENQANVCQNKTHRGSTICGQPATAGHAVVCQPGGGVLHRHNDLRDRGAAWLPKSKKEQYVPKWDRPDEKAVLDVTYHTRSGEEVCLDFSVVAAAPSGGEVLTQLQRREQQKHQRYPGPGLIPFVTTSRGRWGQEALAWARATAKYYYIDDYAAKLTKLKYDISMALQIGVAEQILSCMQGQGPSCF